MAIFGLTLLVLGVCVPPPVTAVHLLTWSAGVVTIATLLMMLAASAGNQRPTRRSPVSRRG